MEFGWSIIQIQPGHSFYEMRKVFRKVLGPNNAGDYDRLIERESQRLVENLASFTGNPVNPLQECV